MDLSNALKSDQYLDLIMDLQARGYDVHLFAIEVGARGLVVRSKYAFLRAIGLSNRQTKHFVKELSEAAESLDITGFGRRRTGSKTLKSR